MGWKDTSLTRHRPPDNARGEATLLAEVQALRRELAGHARRFDEFARVFLKARFPFGKPVDRWRRG